MYKTTNPRTASPPAERPTDMPTPTHVLSTCGLCNAKFLVVDWMPCRVKGLCSTECEKIENKYIEDEKARVKQLKQEAAT